MKKIKKNDNIDSLINENIITIIYFTGIKCGACEVIKKRVEDILGSYPNINCYEIN